MVAETVRAREAEREWGALAVAALVAALAGVVVATITHPVPWYLVMAIALAAVVFLVALGALLLQPRARRRRDRSGTGGEEPLL